MPAPLKYIQYHWSRRDEPRSRILGYFGKAIVEGAAFLFIASLAAGMLHAGRTIGLPDVALVLYGIEVTYGALVGGAMSLQGASMLCSVIPDVEPADYP